MTTKKECELLFFTNSGEWQVVGAGTVEEMQKELKKRSKLFKDADRYKLKLTKR